MDRISRTAGDPRQFRVIDLLALTTLAALVLAMAAPILRTVQEGNRLKLLALVSFQLVVTGVAVAYAAYSRGRLLEMSGQRIAVGYQGTIRWRHWPVVKSSLLMLLLANWQLGCAALSTTAPTGEWFRPSPGFFAFQLQLGFFSGFAFARFLWRVYPSAIEFFENGVALAGMRFIPWQQVDVRPSQYFSDRLVVVVRPAAGSAVASTRLAQVPAAARERILALARQGAGDGDAEMR
jgi:hypothetical protein